MASPSTSQDTSCQLGAGFPVHSQDSSALRICPLKTTPPSSLDFTAKGERRCKRALMWMPFSCVIRMWAEYIVFLQSHAHILASSRLFAGLVFSRLLVLHLWRCRNNHFSSAAEDSCCVCSLAFAGSINAGCATSS